MTLTKREPVSVKFRRFRALSFYSVTVLLIFSPCASAVTVAANVPQYGFQVLPGSIRQINVNIAGLTNAATPTTGSTVYSSPISISVSETVQAIVTATGYAASTVGSAAYTIGSSSPVYVQKCNNFEAWGTGVSCTLTGVGAGHALMIGVYGGTLTSVTSSAAAHPRV